MISDRGWFEAEKAIRGWFNYYNKDPREQTNRYFRRDDDRYNEKLQEKSLEIESALADMSSFEQELLGHMTDISSNIDELFTLAIQLLAGRPLASFADCFIRLGLAFSLDTRLHSAQDAFQSLTTFNRIDRSNAEDTFYKSVKPLLTEETSRGGQWTVVRMLRATGDEALAREASSLASKLLSDRSRLNHETKDTLRLVKYTNPDTARPSTIDEGIEFFDSLSLDTLFSTMTNSIEDHNFQELLPIFCRFETPVAQEKTRAILNELLIRTGIPLRQIILCCEEHIPLVNKDIARGILTRINKEDFVKTLPDRDQSICRNYLLYYVLAQLTAEELSLIHI